jgi:Flp pilus assembly pilin Flp
MEKTLKRLISRVVLQDEGQDLIEYALLTAVIGLAGAAAFNLIAAAMNTTYGSWEDGINSLWEPEPPSPM